MKPRNDLNNLNDEDIRIRASAIIAMGKTGDRDTIGSLIEILENKDEVDWLRGCAAIALGRLAGEEVIPPLINTLQEDSTTVTRAAISALGDVKSERAILPLQRILEDETKVELHAVTVTVLGEIAGYKVIPILLKALASPNLSVRLRAALALADLRTEEALLPFINLVKNGDERLRAVAASALGLIGNKRATEPLIKVLDDKDENVRAIAASSLGCLNDIRAVVLLEKTCDDESRLVRKQAASALLKIRQETELETKSALNTPADVKHPERI